MSVEAITWALAQPVSHSSAKFVLVVLANCASGDGNVAYPSSAYLSEATGQDRKTVLANLQRLRDLGYIIDTGKRVGSTKQVVVYQLNTSENGTVKESQNRNGSESGTVPETDGNSTVFPAEQSRFSAKQSQKRDTEPSEPSCNRKSKRQSKCAGSAERFDEFWAAYPGNAAKPQCLAKWKGKGLDALADTILADIANKKANDRRWIEGFIPNPHTYLNQERWNDPVRPVARGGPTGSAKPLIAQNFSAKTYEGTPDDQLPDFLRTNLA